jgi:hypothetical protein
MQMGATIGTFVESTYRATCLKPHVKGLECIIRARLASFRVLRTDLQVIAPCSGGSQLANERPLHQLLSGLPPTGNHDAFVILGPIRWEMIASGLVCLRCATCQVGSEHVSKYEHDGRPYCHMDYDEVGRHPSCPSSSTPLFIACTL